MVSDNVLIRLLMGRRQPPSPLANSPGLPVTGSASELLAPDLDSETASTDSTALADSSSASSADDPHPPPPIEILKGTKLSTEDNALPVEVILRVLRLLLNPKTPEESAMYIHTASQVSKAWRTAATLAISDEVSQKEGEWLLRNKRIASMRLSSLLIRLIPVIPARSRKRSNKDLFSFPENSHQYVFGIVRSETPTFMHFSAKVLETIAAIAAIIQIKIQKQGSLRIGANDLFTLPIYIARTSPDQLYKLQALVNEDTFKPSLSYLRAIITEWMTFQLKAGPQIVVPFILTCLGACIEIPRISSSPIEEGDDPGSIAMDDTYLAKIRALLKADDSRSSNLAPPPAPIPDSLPPSPTLSQTPILIQA